VSASIGMARFALAPLVAVTGAPQVDPLFAVGLRPNPEMAPANAVRWPTSQPLAPHALGSERQR